MKGFNLIVCTAVCTALVGIMSACTDYGAVGDVGGSANSVVTGGGDDYTDNNDAVDCPEIVTDETDTNAPVQKTDVHSHTMQRGETYSIAGEDVSISGGRAQDT